MAIDPLSAPVLNRAPAPGPVRPPREATRLPAGEVRTDQPTAAVPDVPPTEPPPDALAAVQAASRAYEVLRRSGRELRFETRDDGIVRIDVYDLTGRLVRSIPPDEALAFVTQEASWQA